MAKKSRHRETEEAAPAKVRNITIRPATSRDCSPLYDVLIRYFEDLKLFYPGPDEAATMAWGLSIVVKGGVVLAIEDGRIIGSVGVEVGNYPWNPAHRYLNGVWFYVAPEFRAGGTADRLMKAAKDIAAQNKLALRLDSIWGVDSALQDRYRRQHGFQYVGGNHVWFPPGTGA